MMYPHVFLPQEDVPPLVQALSSFALDLDSTSARKDILVNAGIHSSFRSKLTIQASPMLFANNLVAQFREYRISQQQPIYHPMVSLLDYLVQTFELEDQDDKLFRRLVGQGLDNLKGLNASRSVGRIESPPGTAIGTGVLICRRLLLTCFHVLQDILEQQQDQACVRFGYRAHKYGVDSGQVFELDLKSIERYTPSSNHSLDFAIVGVIGSPGLPVVSLSNDSPVLSQPVHLIHHPRGEPVQISEKGQIARVDREFITHTIETGYGSSGAPIFDSNWRVVALHRGAPTLSRPPAPGTTEGVPISCIWKGLQPYLSEA